ncbi:cysteine--tRNA ligase [Candidatus Korarchaeum cryptofilum]|uniref:Cysteine--tRNA ligase n=1 Tax=Candidatus Korarchaeum cryptofilum TaxID=498846 RepID=A0A3R9QAD0_9CREN|nr:cysteine--tRNA ligase [Candidatus Korarchaeum cryptofilum]RSN70640.1 cysteine--tRNA ligase [Candidatus Korarchaeum cryptofilum]
MTVFADLVVFNTLTRRFEPFEPLVGRRVFMFVCGPTVYDYSHLGHARTYVFYDTLARFLRKLGYSLFYLQNITDVDDKIVNRAAEEGRDPVELAREFESYYYEDMRALNITSVNLYARASDYLKEIFEQVETLIKLGKAYVTESGVYFDITTFPDYGKLSGQRPEELRVHRIEPDPTKRNPGDFALWRNRPREEFGWESPWGYGRPGWHIEDTAISIKHFGKQYDIHGGAIELAFPHHEAEIAQAESFTGEKPFVKYWIHTGLLTVEGEKMSKSLGNFVTIREALREYDANTLRIFLLSRHYRSPIDFRWEYLEQARSSYERIINCLENLKELEIGEGGDEEREFLSRVRERRDSFYRRMLDDVNTAEALGELYELVRDVNSFSERMGKISEAGRNEVISTFSELLDLLGLRIEEGPDTSMLHALISLILDVRENLRRRREYDLADEIRGRMRELGIDVQDTPKGTKWRIIG